MLWGYAHQHYKAFDIIVADDGSGPETADVIGDVRAGSDLDIKHLWQEDLGFRKCRVLNKAIVSAESDYIVFTDGDCIPRADFVQVHVERAQSGYWLSGSYCKLPMSTSRLIDREDISSGRCFRYRWLRENGMPRSKRNIKLRVPRAYAQLANSVTVTRCNLKGANASAWRQDLLSVNGFDERMQWGGLDRELGVRLNNFGLRSRHVRYDAICVHLDHGRGYRDEERVASNLALRKQVEKSGLVETPAGITQLIASGYQPGDGIQVAHSTAHHAEQSHHGQFS